MLFSFSFSFTTKNLTFILENFKIKLCIFVFFNKDNEIKHLRKSELNIKTLKKILPYNLRES